jgi:hypothetical protein
VPRKKEISVDNFAAILKYLMETPEIPIPDYSPDFDYMDIDISAFPPPLSLVLSKKPVADAEMLPMSGSRPICIRVPSRVIRSYKLKAASTGTCYQTLMNRALAAAAKG